MRARLEECSVNTPLPLLAVVATPAKITRNTNMQEVQDAIEDVEEDVLHEDLVVRTFLTHTTITTATTTNYNTDKKYRHAIRAERHPGYSRGCAA